MSFGFHWEGWVVTQDFGYVKGSGTCHSRHKNDTHLLDDKGNDSIYKDQGLVSCTPDTPLLGAVSTSNGDNAHPS